MLCTFYLFHFSPLNMEKGYLPIFKTQSTTRRIRLLLHTELSPDIWSVSNRECICHSWHCTSKCNFSHWRTWTTNHGIRSRFTDSYLLTPEFCLRDTMFLWSEYLKYPLPSSDIFLKNSCCTSTGRFISLLGFGVFNMTPGVTIDHR